MIWWSKGQSDVQEKLNKSFYILSGIKIGQTLNCILVNLPTKTQNWNFLFPPTYIASRQQKHTSSILSKKLPKAFKKAKLKLGLKNTNKIFQQKIMKLQARLHNDHNKADFDQLNLQGFLRLIKNFDLTILKYWLFFKFN